jgi:hypothetical protein
MVLSAHEKAQRQAKAKRQKFICQVIEGMGYGIFAWICVAGIFILFG